MTSKISVALSRESLSGMAKRLREYLAAADAPLKQSHAYEALAKVFGYRNWNTLQAALPSAEEARPEPQRSTEPAKQGETYRHRGIELFSGVRSIEDYEANREAPFFELVKRRIIADPHFGGYLVTLFYRDGFYNIEHEDEVLLRDQDFIQFNVFVMDDQIEPPLSDVAIVKAAVRRLEGNVRHMQHVLSEQPYLVKSTEAPTARPVARWKNPPPEYREDGQLDQTSAPMEA